MTILSLKDFMKKYDLKDDTMTEIELQRICIYKIYPRESIITTKKGFINIDNGQMGGTHWTCFVVKDNKSFYSDTFGGQPDESLIQQLAIAKPLKYYEYKIRDINSNLCGSFCISIFYLIERMK